MCHIQPLYCVTSSYLFFLSSQKFSVYSLKLSSSSVFGIASFSVDFAALLASTTFAGEAKMFSCFVKSR